MQQNIFYYSSPAARYLAVAAALLAGCGGGSGGDGTVTPPNLPPVVTNAAPAISGTPAASVVVGSNYSFVPVASDADGDALSFAVTNLPAWASFDALTGALTGTPGSADVGTYADISLSVSDGTDEVAMPVFAITVADSASGSAMLHWTPPAQNIDGSVLGDLAGYKVYVGSASGSYSQVTEIASPGISSFLVEGLAPGNYFFAVSAYDDAGNESEVSNEVSKNVL